MTISSQAEDEQKKQRQELEAELEREAEVKTARGDITWFYPSLSLFLSNVAPALRRSYYIPRPLQHLVPHLHSCAPEPVNRMPFKRRWGKIPYRQGGDWADAYTLPSSNVDQSHPILPPVGPDPMTVFRRCQGGGSADAYKPSCLLLSWYFRYQDSCQSSCLLWLSGVRLMLILFVGRRRAGRGSSLFLALIKNVSFKTHHFVGSSTLRLFTERGQGLFLVAESRGILTGTPALSWVLFSRTWYNSNSFYYYTTGFSHLK